jgi:GDPmannose 4,6-dehydratase
VEVDPRYYRPTEVHQLLGDAEKAREDLGWTPSTTLDEMAEEMVTHDLEEAREDVVVENQRTD